MWNTEPSWSWNKGLTKVYPPAPASSYYTEEISVKLLPGVRVAYHVEYKRYTHPDVGSTTYNLQRYRKQCLCWSISIPGANDLWLTDVPSIGTCRDIAYQLVKAHHLRTCQRMDASK